MNAGDAPNSSKTVARNAFWLLSQRILMAVVSLVVTAVVARHLGTSSYGLLVVMLSYTALLMPLTSLGLRPYSVREMAAAPHTAAEVLQDMLALRFVLSVGAILLAALYFSLVQHDLPFTLTAVILLQLLVNNLANCFIDSLYGVENIGSVAAVMGISALIIQAGSLVAVWANAGVEGVATAHVMGNIAMLGLAAASVRLRLGPIGGARRASRLHWHHVRNSWIFFYQNAVHTFRSRVDIVLITELLGAHTAGLYGSAQTLIQRIDLLQDGITTAMFPRAANLHGKSPQELQSLVRGVFKVCLVVSTPIAAGLFVTSTEIATLVFGPKFDGSGPMLGIMALSVPFGFAYGILFNVLTAIREQVIVLKASIAATILTVVYFVVGIRLGGGFGAAVALVAGTATLAAPLAVVCHRRLGALSSWLDITAALAANAAMVVVVAWLLAEQSIATRILAGAISYFAGTVVFGLVTIDMLRTLLRRQEEKDRP